MKPTRFITVFCFCTIVLSSCKQHKNDIDYKKLILGEWKCVAEETKRKQPLSFPFTLRIYPNLVSGYTFQPNGICEDKLGYFKKMSQLQDGKNSVKFLGNLTQYKIERDSLKIFNLRDSTWKSGKICSITLDTLTLQYNDSILAKYAKLHDTISTQPLFDVLIVSPEGCYGSCPVNDVLINRTGEFIFHGGYYDDVKGYFSSTLSSKQFEKIESDYGKANFMNLKDDYYTGGADAESITLTFVKNNRIIKTIHDYDFKAPTELYWAITPVSFLHHQLKLDTLQKESNDHLYFNARNFKTSKKICDLYKSEGFYLWYLLSRSKEVRNSIVKKYDVQFYGSTLIKKIESDGRYYKFVFSNGDQKTFDLGYDFLKENLLEKRLRIKEKYD